MQKIYRGLQIRLRLVLGHSTLFLLVILLLQVVDLRLTITPTTRPFNNILLPLLVLLLVVVTTRTHPDPKHLTPFLRGLLACLGHHQIILPVKRQRITNHSIRRGHSLV